MEQKLSVSGQTLLFSAVNSLFLCGGLKLLQGVFDSFRVQSVSDLHHMFLPCAILTASFLPFFRLCRIPAVFSGGLLSHSSKSARQILRNTLNPAHCEQEPF